MPEKYAYGFNMSRDNEDENRRTTDDRGRESGRRQVSHRVRGGHGGSEFLSWPQTDADPFDKLTASDADGHGEDPGEMACGFHGAGLSP